MNLESQILNKPDCEAHEAHCAFQIGCEKKHFVSICIFVSMYNVIVDVHFCVDVHGRAVALCLQCLCSAIGFHNLNLH